MLKVATTAIGLPRGSTPTLSLAGSTILGRTEIVRDAPTSPNQGLADLSQTGNPRAAQSLLGHRAIEITVRYLSSRSAMPSPYASKRLHAHLEGGKAQKYYSPEDRRAESSGQEAWLALEVAATEQSN